MPNNGALTLIKAIMLEGRIVIYSHISSRVSSFIYSLIALFPGCLFFTADDSLAVNKSLRFYKQFGLPLHVFASEPSDMADGSKAGQKGVSFYPLLALPEVDKLDKDRGFLLGTTNQLFLNFPKIKADIVVDLDKFTIQTMTEVRESSKMKQGAPLAPEAVDLQKIMKNHTNYEKKLFKTAGLEPKKPAQNAANTVNGVTAAKMTTAQMAKFNYRGADEEDINGLVDRDESSENELRTIVMSYLQNLFCQMALAKKVIEDFNSVYAPQSRKDSTMD